MGELLRPPEIANDHIKRHNSNGSAMVVCSRGFLGDSLDDDEPFRRFSDGCRYPTFACEEWRAMALITSSSEVWRKSE